MFLAVLMHLSDDSRFFLVAGGQLLKTSNEILLQCNHGSSMDGIMVMLLDCSHQFQFALLRFMDWNYVPSLNSGESFSVQILCKFLECFVV
jgi:hypothetical protein